MTTLRLRDLPLQEEKLFISRLIDALHRNDELFTLVKLQLEQTEIANPSTTKYFPDQHGTNESN